MVYQLDPDVDIWVHKDTLCEDDLENPDVWIHQKSTKCLHLRNQQVFGKTSLAKFKKFGSATMQPHPEWMEEAINCGLYVIFHEGWWAKVKRTDLLGNNDES